MKHFHQILVVLLTTITGLLDATGQGLVRHNFIVGERVDGDQVLYDFPPFKRHRDMLEDSYFTFRRHNIREITRIELKDMYYSGGGGRATIDDGGVGSNYVRAKFQNVRGCGVFFQIVIYGFKEGEM